MQKKSAAVKISKSFAAAAAAAGERFEQRQRTMRGLLDSAAAGSVALGRPRPSCSGVERGFGQAAGQFHTFSSQHQQKGK